MIEGEKLSLRITSAIHQEEVGATKRLNPPPHAQPGEDAFHDQRADSRHLRQAQKYSFWTAKKFGPAMPGRTLKGPPRGLAKAGEPLSVTRE